MAFTPTSELLLILVLATLLGSLMGICIWRLVGGDGPEPGSSRSAPTRRAPGAGVDLSSPTTTDAQRKLAGAPPLSMRGGSQDQRHQSAEAVRIAGLEAELLAAEEQRMRLQRDLATLRASREHGGETVRPEVLRREEEIPVLNRRVRSDAAGGAASTDLTSVDLDLSGSQLLGLSLALDSAADIPALAEADLPASIEELEIEFAGDERGE